MSCFFKKDKNVFILNDKKNDEHFSLFQDVISNGIIEKNEKYIKFSPIYKQKMLSKNLHSIVRNKNIEPNYCNLCQSRLLSLTFNGCSTCSFEPHVEFGSFDFDSLISVLKEKGYYEVDDKNFELEVKEKKTKK